MWDKRHDVPEGFYEVRLVDVKCHNKETYKLQVEILKNGTKPWPEPTVITGYCRRYGTDFGDLEDCFGGGIQKRSSAYVGRVGIISLSHSGWITLMSKMFFTSSDSK